MDRRNFIKVSGAAAAGGWLKTWEPRRWMDEKGITEHHASCVEEDWTLL